MTAAGCAALFAASGRALRQYVANQAMPVRMARERVEFITAPQQVPARVAPSRERSAPATRARDEGREARPGATEAPPPDTGTSRVVPSTVRTPSLAAPPHPPRYLSRSFAPLKPRNPFIPTPLPSRAEMDSMLREMRDSMPALSRLRVMSVAERDSLMRVMATNKLVPGRAAQMPGYPPSTGLANSGMIAAPLFSSGPSAAERRRDSAANVEYLARLRRLQDRALARRESLRVADSMSRARLP